MKKTILLAALAAFVLPSAASAAMYHYIETTGEVKSIEAANASEALVLAHQNGATETSGVKLDLGTLETGEEYGQEYQYISVTGEQESVVAASLDAAAILATDRAPTSGFMIVSQ